MLRPPKVGDVCLPIAPRSFGVACAICVSVDPLVMVDQGATKLFKGFKPSEVVGLCEAKRAIVKRCEEFYRRTIKSGEERICCHPKCGAKACPKCGHCSTEHNEDTVNNCPGTDGNPRPAVHPTRKVEAAK